MDLQQNCRPISKLDLMKKNILFTALLLLAVSAFAADCEVTERDLIGDWKQDKPGAFFEQMTFQKSGGKHQFDSWRHDRPEISQADWHIQDCLLLIQRSGNQHVTRFKVIGLKSGRL